MAKNRGFEAGILLAECLVYIALFFIVTGIAYAVYYRTTEFSRDLRRNTEDIARVLRAGERWREDVREATGDVRVETTTNGVAVLVISQATRDVAYWFYNGQVWRQSGADPEPQSFCAGVKASAMIRESRPIVKSWRWELELKAGRKTPMVRPLFSFQSVPGKAAGTNRPVHAQSKALP